MSDTKPKGETAPPAPQAKRILSIRWIVTGAAVALTALAVVAVGGVAERNAREVLNRELERRVTLEARNLAMTSSRALISDFPELTLAPILKEMDEGRSEVVFTVVVDREGIIRGHKDAREIGNSFTEPAGASPRATEPGDLAEGEQLLENPALLIASSPVLHPNGNVIGRAWVAFDRGHADAVLAEARRNQAIVVAVVLAIGVLVVSIIMGGMLRPVAKLRSGLERIGRGDLDTPVELKDRTEFGLLADTMNRMATAIREAQDERVEKERLDREFELAQDIQASLLPHEAMAAGDYVVEGAHRAALEVGGDLWDVFPLDGGRLGLLIADVSGKGLGGCLVTSMLSALIRAFRNEEMSPSRMLVRLEQALPIRPGTFITMFYGILDPSDGSLVFSSAGHSPMLLHRARDGRQEWYRTAGIPIGAVRMGGALEKTLKDECVRLEPGDVLMQYTDGINEAFDLAQEEQFGFERIESAVREAAPHGAKAVIDRVQNDVANWVGDQAPLDDETLLVVCHQGKPATAEAPPASTPATNGGTAAPAAESDPAADFDAPRVVAEAKRQGHGLKLAADLDRLTAIRPWLETCPGLTLAENEEHVVESVLYEICANVIEHGYGGDAAQALEVWWLPHAADSQQIAARAEAPGLFVVLDRGAAYEPNRPPADLAQPSVRRRGRGLGLTIVKNATSRVLYHPGTPDGNVTVLAFDPQPATVEVSHG